MNTGEFQELVGSAIADPDFERIQLSLREPNIFRALAISRQEIRHSNSLACLFDPQENQGLREIVLRKFLQQSTERSPVPESPQERARKSLQSTRILRIHRRPGRDVVLSLGG
jgi:hypothetical protein